MPELRDAPAQPDPPAAPTMPELPSVDLCRENPDRDVLLGTWPDVLAQWVQGALVAQHPDIRFHSYLVDPGDPDAVNELDEPAPREPDRSAGIEIYGTYTVPEIEDAPEPETEAAADAEIHDTVGAFEQHLAAGDVGDAHDVLGS